MNTDRPQLLSMRALTSPVEADRRTLEEIQDAIVNELELWSRNLFALAETAAIQDSGFRKYRKTFTARMNRYDRLRYELYAPPEVLDKFEKWPLRL